MRIRLPTTKKEENPPEKQISGQERWTRVPKNLGILKYYSLSMTEIYKYYYVPK